MTIPSFHHGTNGEGFQSWGYPEITEIINFHRMFHYKPSMLIHLGSSIYGSPHMMNSTHALMTADSLEEIHGAHPTGFFWFGAYSKTSWLLRGGKFILGEGMFPRSQLHICSKSHDMHALFLRSIQSHPLHSLTCSTLRSWQGQ